MEVLYWTILIIGGFLLGSIMFSQWIPKLLAGKDICNISVDNNPGTFNAFKYCGKKIGFLCLSLDVLKGFVPVLLASLFLNVDSVAFSLVMFAPALGHAIGLFNHFRGGKCIATSFGVMLGILPVAWAPIVTLASLYIFLSAIVKIENAAKRSVVVYSLFMVISCTVLGFMGQPFVAIGCGLVAVLPIIKFLFSQNGMVENRFHDENKELNQKNTDSNDHTNKILNET